MEPLPNQGHQLSGICAEVCFQGLSETVEYTIQSTAYSSLWGTELKACVAMLLAVDFSILAA